MKIISYHDALDDLLGEKGASLHLEDMGVEPSGDTSDDQVMVLYNLIYGGNADCNGEPLCLG